ncbi:RNA polymerase sigma factor region1.1 domain-containing protein, partial [Parafrankia colletiae]|uniref:RNA polymerase sigma factor region1.1 domain-containing protein n=1 Tax=Parafrankia colletiae TaxID=573497 RepID=UPI000B13F1E9
MSRPFRGHDETPPTDLTTPDEATMKKVGDLIARGKENGFVTPDDVAATLLAAELPPERSDVVLQLLAEDGIEVLDETGGDASEILGRRREGEEL